MGTEKQHPSLPSSLPPDTPHPQHWACHWQAQTGPLPLCLREGKNTCSPCQGRPGSQAGNVTLQGESPLPPPLPPGSRATPLDPRGIMSFPPQHHSPCPAEDRGGGHGPPLPDPRATSRAGPACSPESAAPVLESRPALYSECQPGRKKAQGRQTVEGKGEGGEATQPSVPPFSVSRQPWQARGTNGAVYKAVLSKSPGGL